MAEAAHDAARLPVHHARDGPGELRATCSVQRGRIPRQGAGEAPFVWEDLLDAPRPPGRGRGEGSYAVYHGTEIEGDVRVACSTLVQVVREEGTEAVRVDSRLTVQRRAFLEMMDRERILTDRVTSRWRRRLLSGLVAQRAAANRLRRPALVRAAVKVIRLEARVGLGVIGATRRAMRGLAQAPDAVASRVLKAQAHLGLRAVRRRLLAGLRDPQTLSAEQKGVLLFLLLAGVLAAVMSVGALLALFAPPWTVAYQTLVADGTAAFLGAVALPLPTEAFVVASTLSMGPVVGFTGSFLGKMLGVMVLYLIGDSLHAKVERATAGRPRTHRAVAWVKANADRHGFLALALLNVVPLFPDVLLYAFALSGMRFRPYMAGIALGTALKFGGLVAGVMLLGPERVLDLLSNPFGL